MSKKNSPAATRDHRNGNKHQHYTFDRERQPHPVSYMESINHPLQKGAAEWNRAINGCPFSDHNDKNSSFFMRYDGPWICHGCLRKGGDVLALHMQLNNMSFRQASFDLGCMVASDGSRPTTAPKSKRPSKKALEHERMVLDIGEHSTSPLSKEDLARVNLAKIRLQLLGG